MEQCQALIRATTSLDTSALARSVATKTCDSQVEGQLLFLPGQYLFATNQGSRTNYKFLSPSSVKAAFSNIPIDSDFLPPNTIKWGTNSGGEYLVQYFPPPMQGITLTNSTENRLLAITVPMPGLVFMGWGQSYWLWCVKDKQLTPESQLFHVPLPNVMQSGSICFGTTPRIPCSAIGISHSWAGFWSSPFNDHVVQSKSREFPSDVRGQLLKLHGQKAKRYPLKDLISCNKNVTDTIKSIIKYQ